MNESIIYCNDISDLVAAAAELTYHGIVFVASKNDISKTWQVKIIGH